MRYRVVGSPVTLDGVTYAPGATVDVVEPPAPPVPFLLECGALTPAPVLDEAAPAPVETPGGEA